MFCIELVQNYVIDLSFLKLHKISCGLPFKKTSNYQIKLGKMISISFKFKIDIFQIACQKVLFINFNIILSAWSVSDVCYTFIPGHL